MKKAVFVKEYATFVRTVEVIVDVDKNGDAYEEAVDQLRNVGLTPESVYEAGMTLISDFEYVDGSSDYEPEEV